MMMVWMADIVRQHPEFLIVDDALVVARLPDDGSVHSVYRNYAGMPPTA